jgi:hypothetical protein
MQWNAGKETSHHEGVVPWNKTDLYGFILLFAFVMALIGSVRMAWRGHAMKNWAATDAVVERAKIVDEFSRRRRPKTRLDCAYTYNYGGNWHRGTEVAPAQSLSDEEEAEWCARLTRHKERGEPLPCYVNPEKPTESALDRSYRWSDSAVGLGVSVACLLLSMGILFRHRFS